ncbi:peroxiredoxin family protein [Candidatus Methylopumilus rimovensis]|jgi:peroxiredoxin|uniref:TlpA family protein disulfide reductase n=1 Tax=Candidatus Methylopumilus rimovensis TaxID=2588535 RepID=A0AAE6KPN2_9PROT|nr:TlpA disulfide reductase family protein [Candidatus Methylopumilus rimovensis]QDD12560.1 TlpA family protein disulfide reductase [Candidatus Methylopumilus rimovensis]QDD13862.1 TlpA family protein disulfide reductase [Candidatus Methylopumilus rimovensis]
MAKKSLWLLLVLLTLLVLFFLSLATNKKVPEIAVTSITGEAIKLYQNKNNFTIINFWATDCPGCIKEMPGLTDIYNQFKGQGLQIIAVSMSYDPPNQVLNFTQKNKIPFPVVLDVDGQIARSFEDIRLTPTSILIDKNGKIIDKVIGELDFNKLNVLLKKHLNS